MARKSIRPPQAARLGLVFRQELTLLRRDRSTWWAASLFVLLLGYALFNGIVQTQARSDAQDAFRRDDAEQRARQTDRLQRILDGREAPTPFGNPANPEHVAGGFGAQHAWLPPAPLSPVALGQSDLFPAQFKVTYRSKVSFLQSDDIENPWNLLAGEFDLAFVIVYLMPLLVIAVSYNLLSAERESGTLRLLLSQPVALRTLLTGKVAARAVVLLGIATVGPVGALLVARPHDLASAGVDAFLWAMVVAAYATFWFVTMVAVNAFGRSSATNAVVSVVAWVVLVLVLPVLLNVAVTTAAPAPSRMALAASTRVATANAMARNAALLATDYQHVADPDLLRPKNGHIALAGRALANYRVEREVDDVLAAELARFDRQQARQQTLVARYAVLSPAAVAYEAFAALAGNGRARYARFLVRVDEYHRAWKGFFFPRIDDQRALTTSDYAAIPTYRWRDPEPTRDAHFAWIALVQLVMPTLLIAAIAAMRFARFRVA